MNYTIYVDGAASMEKKDNSYERRAGGHAFVIYESGVRIYEQSDGAPITTNNEQELLAILDTLKWLEMNSKFDSFSEATIYSDSAYCVNICNDWRKKWKKNGWTRGRKHEPIENLEIIKEISERLDKMNVKVEKVKGHGTCAGNIRADELAVETKKKFM